jgi:hypothetical protein
MIGKKRIVQQDWKCIQSFTRENQGFWCRHDCLSVIALQDCIVQTTNVRTFLPPRWSPNNKATGLRPDNSRTATWVLPGCSALHWQVLKLHVCAPRSPAAATGSQTAVTVMQWLDTKLQQQQQQSKMYTRASELCKLSRVWSTVERAPTERSDRLSCPTGNLLTTRSLDL